MASKRLPLSFPELEPRGRAAILRTSEEVNAEAQLLESHHASKPEDREASLPASRNASLSASQRASMQESQQASSQGSQLAGNRPLYSKATYRLSLEAIEAIEDTRRILRRFGIKASLQEIAEEAILASYRDLLESQHASILVSRLADKPEDREPRNGR